GTLSRISRLARRGHLPSRLPLATPTTSRPLLSVGRPDRETLELAEDGVHRCRGRDTQRHRSGRSHPKRLRPGGMSRRENRAHHRAEPGRGGRAVSLRTLVLALALTACVPAAEEDVDPKGAVGVATKPSPATAGEPFATDDGWTVRIRTVAVQAYIIVLPDDG